jgi:hypothetical protein
MNTNAKGNYHRVRTEQWLKAQGYTVGKVETQSRIFKRDLLGKPEFLFRKSDLWGGDLVAKNETELVWIQVKANAGDIASGKHQLLKAAPWPKFVQLWVVHWPERRRLSDGPDIHVVET